MTDENPSEEKSPVSMKHGADDKLVVFSLEGKDPTIWKSFRTSLSARLSNLYSTVADLDTFKRRTVGAELNRLIHAIIESAHSTLELPSAKNAKTKAEVEAALAKAELDRASARVLGAQADEQELLNRQKQQRISGREIQRRIARGDVQVIEEKGETTVVLVPSKEHDD